MPKAVVLLSGGLDSTVALAEVLQDRHIECALTFNYGQRAWPQELQAAKAITSHYKVPHEIVALPWLEHLLPQALRPGEISHAALSEADRFEVQQVWVPNRNGIFLNIAAGFAEACGADTVVFGANAEEGCTFPDNTPAYREMLNHALRYSTLNPPVQVKAPLEYLSKLEIIQRAHELSVPLDLVWSCYEAAEVQCGQCASCLRVRRAMEQYPGAMQALMKAFGK